MDRISKRRPSQKCESGGEAADPDTGGGRFAEMKSAVGGAKSEGFIVFAAGDGELGTGMKMEAVEEF